jgi:hypothetical protein
MKKVLTVMKVTFVLVLVLGGFWLFTYFRPEIFVSSSASSAMVKDRLVALSQWTTLKYEYSNVIISRFEGKISLPGLSDFTYAEEIKMIRYSGYLKAGTDMQLVEVSFDSTNKVLVVRVPHAQVLDNVVETEMTTVEDVKGNIFLDYPSQLVFDEINANKRQLVEAKIDAGFLVEADERIEELLITLLTTLGYEEVKVEFK